MSSTRAAKDAKQVEEKEPSQEFQDLIRRQLELVGEDPQREGLLATPRRVAQ